MAGGGGFVSFLKAAVFAYFVRYTNIYCNSAKCRCGTLCLFLAFVGQETRDKRVKQMLITGNIL
jgi:hypothetical protein